MRSLQRTDSMNLRLPIKAIDATSIRGRQGPYHKPACEAKQNWKDAGVDTPGTAHQHKRQLRNLSAPNLQPARQHAPHMSNVKQAPAPCSL